MYSLTGVHLSRAYMTYQRPSVEYSRGMSHNMPLPRPPHESATPPNL